MDWIFMNVQSSVQSKGGKSKDRENDIDKDVMVRESGGNSSRSREQSRLRVSEERKIITEEEERGEKQRRLVK